MCAAALSPTRLLLLGDGLWAAAALRHLAAQGRVAAVVERARPTDHRLGDAARACGLECRRFTDIHAAHALEWIRSLGPDLLLSVSYDQIFGPLYLEPGPVGITRPMAPLPPVINVHAGHPGRHRGRAVLCWQLLEGARTVDLCALRVTRGIDKGPLLARTRVALEAEDDYGAALERVSAAVPALLDAALASLAEGGGPAATAGAPVYYPRRLPGDEWIDWSAGSEAILRLVRALAPPNPQARTRRGDEEILVGGAASCPDFPAGAAGAPGAVIGRDKERGLLVKTGDGALWISRLTDAAGLPLPPRALRLSDRLGSSSVAELESLRLRVHQLEERLARLEERRLPVGEAQP